FLSLLHVVQHSQQAMCDATQREMEILSETQNRVSAALQRLCGARDPGQLLAVQSDVASAFLHGASLQTHNALELVGKLQEGNATMLTEIAGKASSFSARSP
ncbi:phasin family protein, partial [Roseomonas chloroacetimidivorans]|uniref:phasin family protein n=1 Tax=Roseomonas chloroacetimidivorans TaxID=1766656 RepID=UPI003C764557